MEYQIKPYAIKEAQSRIRDGNYSGAYSKAIEGKSILDLVAIQIFIENEIPVKPEYIALNDKISDFINSIIKRDA